METELRVAYADVRPGDLAWRLGLEPQPALAALRVPVGPCDVELRLLGASHQVLLRVHGAPACSETVASADGGELPPRAVRVLHGAAYAFSSDVRALAPDEFSATVAALRADLADRDDALIGTFPGLPDALTGLRVEPDGVGWRTWHTYPQTSELVVTRSLVRFP